MRIFIMIAAAVMLAGSVSAAERRPSAQNGKALFAKVGCYECHGYLGQGSSFGAKLAPDPLPLEAFSAFVRGTSADMPPYTDKILSEADLNDIHAYLASIPKAQSPDSIPLLGGK